MPATAPHFGALRSFRSDYAIFEVFLPISAVLLVGTSLPLAAEQSGITASLDAGVLNIKATETFTTEATKQSTRLENNKCHGVTRIAWT